jgi:hypothetical protein
LLSHERESYFLSCESVSRLLFNSDQIICTQLQKIFPHQSQAFRRDLLFCPVAPLDKIKDRIAASSAPRVFASTEKQDDTSFAKI